MGRQIDYKHEAIIKQLSSINRKLGTITGDGDGEGEGGDDSSHTVDIMDVTNGASVELLTDPRIWFESNHPISGYSIGETSLVDYDIDLIPEGPACGTLRFYFSDEKLYTNPFEVNTAFSDKPFPDALRVSADKIPYVIDLILHRFLDVGSQYGRYYNPNYLQIIKMFDKYNDTESHDYYTVDPNPFTNRNTNKHLSNIVNCHNCERSFKSIDNMISNTYEEYDLVFLNIDNEVFPNGEMVWIPFIGHDTQQAS